MGDRRRGTCLVQGRAVERLDIVVERRINGAGSHDAQAYPCNELIVMMNGQALVRRSGEGVDERCLARAGTGWTGPMGFLEKAVLSDPIDCVHLCLPSGLLHRSAEDDFEVDASKIELAFAGGFHDRFVNQVAQSLWNLSTQPPHAADHMLVDGLTAALVAHVVKNYTVDRWTPKSVPRAVDPRRLKHVVDYIEANLDQSLTLDELAAQACLSPFHFSRLFKEATGASPLRYVTQRRVEAAKTVLLQDDSSLLDISRQFGFGSLDTFIRVFRRTTGETPARYRTQSRG